MGQEIKQVIVVRKDSLTFYGKDHIYIKRYRYGNLFSNKQD